MSIRFYDYEMVSENKNNNLIYTDFYMYILLSSISICLVAATGIELKEYLDETLDETQPEPIPLEPVQPN